MAVPFDGGPLPGYLVRPRRRSGTDRPRVPTLIGVGGFDSSAEELYFHLGAPGAERGWNVFVFDGPGQPGCMRIAPRRWPSAPTTRCRSPPSSTPCAPVPMSIADRLALAGQSFGSYFAARGAAADPRVRALVANPPVVDMSRYMEAWVGTRGLPHVAGHPSRGRDRGARGPHAPPDAVGHRRHLPPLRRAVVPCLARRDGAAFRLGDRLSPIRCPSLALVGDREGDEPGRSSPPSSTASADRSSR